MDGSKTDNELARATGDNVPEQLPGPGLSGSIEKVPPEEARNRKKVLRRLIQTTLSDTEIEHAMHKAFGVSRNYVLRLEREIFAEWAEADKKRAPFRKVIQKDRLVRSMVKMQEDKAWSAYANAEKLLAMVEGNMEPTEINIPANDRLGEALLAVLGQMDPNKARALIDSGRVLYEKGNVQVIGRSERQDVDNPA